MYKINKELKELQKTENTDNTPREEITPRKTIFEIEEER